MLSKWTKRLFSAGMALCLAVGLMPPVLAQTPEKQADADTHTSYLTALGTDTSTRYNGRVWSDKTVSADALSFDGKVGGAEVHYSYTADPAQGEEFLVAFSTLATSEEVTHLPKVPVDVVYVLDFSASMTWGTDSQAVVNTNDASGSRIAALVKALNQSIHQLQQDSPLNRIGVVYFNRIGHQWLDLTQLGDTVPADTDQDGTPDYFSVASFTGTANQDDGEATVQCNFGDKTGTVAQTDSKTNIQFGLNLGMRMLADAQDTTFRSDRGNTYTRIPNVVLMSDGAPTTISLPGDGTSWWDDLQENGGDSVGWGDNERPWSANGFMPMITAQYLKEQVTGHYTGQATALGARNVDQAEASFYTIGFSVNQQSDGMVELANLVLDPAHNWEKAKNSDFDALRAIADAWAGYAAGGDAKVKYPEDKSDSYPEGGKSFSVTHNGGWNAPETPDYVDAYYPANDADQLADAFRQIINEITETAKSPTAIENNDPLHGGYITYTDPLGKYMEVKEIKALLFAGEEFLQYQTSTQGNVTTYTFSGTIDSEVYGQQDASQILITVTENGDGTRTLQVKVPAAAIPLRVNHITVNEDGSVQENIYNDAAYPLRVIYGVGPVDNAGVLLACDPDYAAANGAGNNGVYLYSNLYSGTDLGIDSSTAKRGDATVTFQPARNNPFYFLQEDTPLYADAACQTRATGTLDAAGTYYFKIRFYAEEEDVAGQPDVTLENGVATAVITRQGSALLHEGVDVQTDGQGLYIAKGSPRLGNLSDLAVAKTGTDPVTPAYAFATAAARQNGEWVMTSYLGNNGRMAITPADLKTVTDANGNDLNGREVQVGQELTYTIHYGNSAATKENITITDTIPEGTEYLAGSADQGALWDEQSRTLTWTLQDVEPGTTGSVSFKVTVTSQAQQLGTLTNQGKIRIGANGPAITTNTVTVQANKPAPTPGSTPAGGQETNPTPTGGTATPQPSAVPMDGAGTTVQATGGTIPQTGDSSQPQLWASCMVLSALGFVGLLLARRQRR